MLKGGILFYFVKFLGKKDSILVNVIDIFFYKYKGRSSYIIWMKFFKNIILGVWEFFCFERGYLIKI